MTEKHFIEVENKEKVSAIHHEAGSEKWIFYCHGFGSDKKGNYIGRCEKAVEAGFNAVRFDFRGNGESDGEFIEQTLSRKIKDLKAVISHFGPERYVFFGSSFGGKVILHTAIDKEPEAVIGRAPVTYNEIMKKYRSVVEEKGEFTHHPGATIDERFYKDFENNGFGEVIEKLEIPVAIFHGSCDTTVHPEYSFRAARQLNTDVLLQKLEGEKHSFSNEAEDYMRDSMISWLQRNVF